MSAVALAPAYEAPPVAWVTPDLHEIGYGSVATIALDDPLTGDHTRRGVIIRWLAGQGWLLLDRPEPDGRTYVDFGPADVVALDDVPLSIRERGCLCLAYCEVLV